MKTSDEIIARFDIMPWVETKKPEPEWVKVFDGALNTMATIANPSRIKDFIRTEILTKFAEECKKEIYSHFDRNFAVSIDAVLKRYL